MNTATGREMGTILLLLATIIATLITAIGMVYAGVSKKKGQTRTDAIRLLVNDIRGLL